MAANRGVSGVLPCGGSRCEYSRHGPGLPVDVALSPSNANSGLAKDRPMMEGDSDAEVADYGTDFSDDVDPR